MACTVLAVGAGQQAAVLADFDRVLLVTLWELENSEHCFGKEKIKICRIHRKKNQAPRT